jgi:CheY-like chemotaxis protein
MAHILIVDDNPTLRAAMHRLLAGHGHRVTQASSGREALRVFRAGGVDLVVLETVMPEMDGVETLAALRKIDRSARVLAVSGGGSNASSLYLEISKAMGATQILAKPFSPENFLCTVAAALNHCQEATREAPSVPSPVKVQSGPASGPFPP